MLVLRHRNLNSTSKGSYSDSSDPPLLPGSGDKKSNLLEERTMLAVRNWGFGEYPLTFCVLGILAIVCLVVIMFVPYVNGILLWYMRIRIDFVKPPYVDSPQNRTCFLTTLNRWGKQKYKHNLEQNEKWVNSRGWKYYEYLEEDHNRRLNTTVNIMFLKYHGIDYLFQHEQCEVVMYLDADAVVIPEQASQPIPLSKDRDVVFGNEVFVFAMHQVGSDMTKKGVLNAGFLLLWKTDFSHQFIQDVLTHARCDGCRDKFCFDLAAGYDQGCIDKLLSNEYSNQLHRFGVGRVQTPVARPRGNLLAYTPGNLLFCHPAGLIKDFYEDPCDFLK